jgi:hypothetical protein
MAKTSKRTKKQQETIRQLEKLARQVGLRVSWGKLRFAGLKLKGGQCLFKGEKWLVLDRAQPYEDQLDSFREALRECDLTGREVPPELTGLLDLPILAEVEGRSPQAS